ncbi:hypothetical protein ACFQ60_45830 [Streptomyces zhihengii]
MDRAPGGRYKVKPLSPVIDRPLVLTVRHGSVPPGRGEELDCWVFANETTQTVLTADQRGRSPVSERMAGRYAAALDVLTDLTESDGDVPDARIRLSELQGMANRVLRRDQADWVAVLHLLGDPDRERLGALRDLAATVNRALKEGTFDAGRLAEALAASGWAEPLAEARGVLHERFGTATPPGSDTAVPSTPAQPDQKEEEQMTAADTTATATAPPEPTTMDGFLRALETAADTDRACKKHEAVRHALKSSLLWADLQPADSAVVDVSCVTRHGLFLYEALGAGRSAYADLRSGATRLLEINHTLPAPADGLYLVLSEPPADDWSADTIRDVFRVNVIWRTPPAGTASTRPSRSAPPGAPDRSRGGHPPLPDRPTDRDRDDPWRRRPVAASSPSQAEPRHLRLRPRALPSARTRPLRDRRDRPAASSGGRSRAAARAARRCATARLRTGRRPPRFPR